MKDEIEEALSRDHGRSAFMTWFMEIGLNVACAQHALKHLKTWA